jgi:hypothetical protein
LAELSPTAAKINTVKQEGPRTDREINRINKWRAFRGNLFIAIFFFIADTVALALFWLFPGLET